MKVFYYVYCMYFNEIKKQILMKFNSFFFNKNALILAIDKEIIEIVKLLLRHPKIDVNTITI